MIKTWYTLLFCLMISLPGCDAPVSNIRVVGRPNTRSFPSAHEDLDATLWMQTSAEYGAITEMVYDSAWQHIEHVLDQPNWSALPKQRIPSANDAKSLTPAVILDVDETVLDNSAYQVRLIQLGGEYEKTTWLAFCDLAESTAVPGSQQFIDRCRAAKISVYFLTNRDAVNKASTCRNLIALGMLPEGDEQHVLCKGEHPDWTSDKQSRREFVARDHRVLAMLGDDLNDFVSVGVKPTPSDRIQLSRQYQSMWGHGWFMLPNANYGGWERALYDWNDGLPQGEKIERKLSLLRGPGHKPPLHREETKTVPMN